MKRKKKKKNLNLWKSKFQSQFKKSNPFCGRNSVISKLGRIVKLNSNFS